MFLQRYASSNDRNTCALVLVDQLSRKAFVIPMRNKSTPVLLEAYKKFERQIAPIVPSLIKGDDDFNNKTIRDYITGPDDDPKSTALKTVVTSSENVTTGGGPLRIVDRFILSLRRLLTQYFLAHRTTDWVHAALPAALEAYNDHSVHGSVGVAPSEAFHNADDLLALRLGDLEYNANLTATGQSGLLPINTVVRLVAKRNLFDKASDSHRVSHDRYVISGVKNGKYVLEGLTRLFKTTEVVRAKDQSPPTPGEEVAAAVAAAVAGEDPRGLARSRARLNREGLSPERDAAPGASRPPRKARAASAARSAGKPQRVNPKLDLFDDSDGD